MSYYVYEDRATNDARIHRSQCSFCNNGKGVQPHATDKYRQWHGPFETYAAALNLAQNIGRKVSHCQHCHPKWEL